MDNNFDNTEIRTAKPFATLEELYNRLKNLESWPGIVKLRECTDYVYSGNEICDLKGIAGQLSKLNRDKKPKTIICHDMKGGYLADRFLDGCSANNSYLFYHWSIIDIFIYFSHYLVTIPPYGWINAAHSHGVKVLGTVITERTDGEIVWEQILSSMEETKKFADALVMLAKYYKFEGWFLNIENEIKKEHIQQLLYFIQYLTTKIHTEIEGSEVIWYDSVTADGELKWQNQLNDRNKAFFENCDGIFLNYNWTDARLATSRAIADLKNRVQDVYVGLDVWGRGCPGGGGFNSIEALRNIRKHDLSVAIFAPGWTHENFNAKEFELIENIFWAQLVPFLYIHVPIYENVSFTSSFCHGAGEKFYYNGEYDEISSQPFYNLSWQEPQVSVPSIHLKFTSVNCRRKKNEVKENQNSEKKYIPTCIYETALQSITVRGHEVNVIKKLQPGLKNNLYVSEKYPYNGGGSIKITTNRSNVYYRLFLLYLEFESDIQIILIHRSNDNSDMNDKNNQTKKYPTLVLESNQSFQFIEPYETFDINEKWKQSYYRRPNIRTISEIGISFSKEGSYYLGKIQIQTIPAMLV